MYNSENDKNDLPEANTASAIVDAYAEDFEEDEAEVTEDKAVQGSGDWIDMVADSVVPEEVGYKKPPKSKQFQKGKSGNPKGRPRKKLLVEVLESELNKEVSLTVNGKKVWMTQKEVLLKKMLQDALHGKSSAIKNLFLLMRDMPRMPPM